MLSIKNWAKFQHFKDRSPPWIKLYRDLLDDLQWHKLDPVAAKTLVMLWLIASENDGHLPDTEELAFRLRMPESDLLAILPKLSHWIDGDCITAISPRYHDDDKPISLTRSRETETEEETEREAEGEEERASAPPAPKPTKAARPRKTPLPDGFGISERVAQWAAEKGHRDLDLHLESFIGKARAKGYTYLDWDEAFMNAIRDNWAKVGQRPHPARESTADHNKRELDAWLAESDDGRTIDA